jgi:Insertion element 4 transposase N-terminal
MRVIRVAGGRFAPGHLGELTRIVPFEMVDAALAETRTRQQRVRDLPSRVVVYPLLAGALFAGLGYVQVWARMTAGLDGLDVAAPTAGGLAQARRRIGIAPLQARSTCSAVLRPARNDGPGRCATGPRLWRRLPGRSECPTEGLWCAVGPSVR